MKHIKKYIITALSFLAVFGCSRSAEDGLGGIVPGSDPIEMLGGGTVPNRLETDTPFRLYAFGGTATSWVTPYFNDAATLTASGGIMLSGPYYWPVSGSLRFAGLMLGGDVTAPTFTTTDGTLNLTAGEGLSHDYMLSNGLTAGKTTATADKTMQFRHLMTQLIVATDTEAGLGVISVQYSIPAGKQAGTLGIFADENDFTVPASAGGDYLIAYSKDVYSSEPGRAVYYLIADGTSKINEIRNLKVNGTDIAATIPITPPSEGAELMLLPGKSYELNINIKQISAASVDFTAGTWNDKVVNDLGDITPEASENQLMVVWSGNEEYINRVKMIEIIDGDGNRYLSKLEGGQTTGLESLPLTVSAVKLHFGQGVVTELATTLEWDVLTVTGITGGTLPVFTPAQLDAVRGNLGGRYVQMSDLDLSGYDNWEPIGTHSENLTATAFTGTYDGRGYKITNLKINSPENDNAGLFGFLYSAGAMLKDIHIASGTVICAGYSGVLCAVNHGGTIENCSNAGSITGTATLGGICGENYISSHIVNCTNSGTVTGTGNDVGGVVGVSYDDSRVIQCENSGNVSGVMNVGGVTGLNVFGSVITECVNSGNVNGATVTGGVGGLNQMSSKIISCINYGKVSGDNIIGGVVGQNYSDISDCINSGRVSGDNTIGGVAGQNSSQVFRCTNSEEVSGDNIIGGVCGRNKNTTTSCYNTGRVNGTEQIGGVAGINDGIITSCYNTSQVNGTGQIGGVAGVNDGTITSCYNTSQVNGTSIIGGICGKNLADAALTSCFWVNYDSGAGIGENEGSTVSVLEFGDPYEPDIKGWPSVDTGSGGHAAWGIGTGSANSHWKSLGGWNGGNPVYPKLWWE